MWAVWVSGFWWGLLTGSCICASIALVIDHYSNKDVDDEG